MPGFHDVTQQLVDAGWELLPEAPIRGVLVPNQGVLFKSDTVHAQLLMDPYPIVRWSDRYGTRWEHRLGKVRRIRDDESGCRNAFPLPFSRCVSPKSPQRSVR